jgi:hypothetical protein
LGVAPRLTLTVASLTLGCFGTLPRL